MAGTYLYGIAPAGRLPSLHVAGLDEQPLRLVSHGALAALASDAPADLRGKRRELRRHTAVLEEAIRHSPVAPMAFGVMLPDDAAVVEDLLRPHQSHLLQMLTAVGERIEVRVRGYYDEDSVLTEVVTDQPELRTGAAGLNARIQLGERIAEALEDKRETDERHVLGRLRPLALDAVRMPPATEMTVFDVAFLLDRDALEPFDAAVSSLGTEIGHRVRLKYVGPMPPATFVDLTLPT